MSRFWLGLVWTPAAPWQADDAVARRWWLVTCLLNFLPVAATLHNVLFYRATCMINPFGLEYTPEVMLAMLRRDPSLVCAAIVMSAIYWLGRRSSTVRLIVAPVFPAFLPATIWVWDIPWSGRILCELVHDGRLAIYGWAIRSRHVYALCLLIYAVLLGITTQYNRRPSVAPVTSPSLR